MKNILGLSSGGSMTHPAYVHRIYELVSPSFRRRRMTRFQSALNVTPETLVLDIGGNEFNWDLLEVPPKVVIVNLYPPQDGQAASMRWIVADATRLPFRDEAFDIAYSNSVIEHLGCFANQQLFANEVSRVGKHFYVQTPSRWFPIEPHLLTPLVHYLPLKWQKNLLRNFTIWGLITRPSQEYCNSFMEEIELLTRKKFTRLFPDSEIWNEKVLGVTKSFMAVKRSSMP